MNSTQELYDLYTAKKLKPFAEEMYRGLDAIFAHEGKRFWSVSDAARKFQVTPAQARGWLRGFNIPDVHNCRKIAQVIGVQEEMMLSLAGHPTFTELLSQVEQHRFTWNDGKYIYSALQLTQERPWRFSKSPWKERAERDLQRHWPKEEDERYLHSFALDIAQIIDIWAADRQREVPLYQRQVAMSA